MLVGDVAPIGSLTGKKLHNNDLHTYVCINSLLSTYIRHNYTHSVASHCWRHPGLTIYIRRAKRSYFITRQMLSASRGEPEYLNNVYSLHM